MGYEMRSIVSTYDRVLKLLQSDEKYRNSDEKLFLRMLDDLGMLIYSKKQDQYFIPVKIFMNRSSKVRFSSITRARRLVQANYKELKPTDPTVIKLRISKEATKGTFPYHEAYNPAHDD